MDDNNDSCVVEGEASGSLPEEHKPKKRVSLLTPVDEHNNRPPVPVRGDTTPARQRAVSMKHQAFLEQMRRLAEVEDEVAETLLDSVDSTPPEEVTSRPPSEYADFLNVFQQGHQLKDENDVLQEQIRVQQVEMESRLSDAKLDRDRLRQKLEAVHANVRALESIGNDKYRSHGTSKSQQAVGTVKHKWQRRNTLNEELHDTMRANNEKSLDISLQLDASKQKCQSDERKWKLELQQLVAEVEREKSLNKTLEKALQDTAENLTSTHEHAVKRLQQEITNLESELKTVKKQKAEELLKLQEDNTDIRANTHTAQLEIKRLQLEIQQAERDNTNATKKIKRLENDMEHANAASTRSLTALEERLKDVENKKESFHSDVRQRDRKIQELEEDIKELQRSLDTEKKKETTLTQSHQELLKREKDKLKKVETDHQLQRTAFEDRLQDYIDKVTDRDTQLTQLNIKIADLEQAVNNAEKDTSVVKQTLETEAACYDKKIAELHALCEKEKKSNSTLEEQLQEAKDALQTSSQDCRDKEKLYQAVLEGEEQLKTDLKKMEIEKTAVQEQLQLLQAKCKECRDKADRMEQENDQLQTAADDSRRKARDLEAEVEHVTQRWKTLLEDKQQSFNQSMETITTGWDEERKRIRTALSEAKMGWDQEREKSHHLYTEIQGLKGELEDVRSMLELQQSLSPRRSPSPHWESTNHQRENLKRMKEKAADAMCNTVKQKIIMRYYVMWQRYWVTHHNVPASTDPPAQEPTKLGQQPPTAMSQQANDSDNNSTDKVSIGSKSRVYTVEDALHSSLPTVSIDVTEDDDDDNESHISKSPTPKKQMEHEPVLTAVSSQLQPHPQPHTHSQSKPHSQPQSQPQPPPQSKPQPQSQLHLPPSHLDSKPDLQSQSQPQSHSHLDSKPDLQSQSQPQPHSHLESKPQLQSHSHPSPQPHSPPQSPAADPQPHTQPQSQPRKQRPQKTLHLKEKEAQYLQDQITKLQSELSLLSCGSEEDNFLNTSAISSDDFIHSNINISTSTTPTPPPHPARPPAAQSTHPHEGQHQHPHQHQQQHQQQQQQKQKQQQQQQQQQQQPNHQQIGTPKMEAREESPLLTPLMKDVLTRHNYYKSKDKSTQQRPVSNNSPSSSPTKVVHDRFELDIDAIPIPPVNIASVDTTAPVPLMEEQYPPIPDNHSPTQGHTHQSTNQCNSTQSDIIVTIDDSSSTTNLVMDDHPSPTTHTPLPAVPNEHPQQQNSYPNNTRTRWNSPGNTTQQTSPPREAGPSKYSSIYQHHQQQQEEQQQASQAQHSTPPRMPHQQSYPYPLSRMATPSPNTRTANHQRSSSGIRSNSPRMTSSNSPMRQNNRHMSPMHSTTSTTVVTRFNTNPAQQQQQQQPPHTPSRSSSRIRSNSLVQSPSPAANRRARVAPKDIQDLMASGGMQFNPSLYQQFLETRVEEETPIKYRSYTDRETTWRKYF